MEFLKIINGQINIDYKYGKMHAYFNAYIKTMVFKSS